MSKLHEKPSALKREHLALKQMKFNNFFSLCLWVILPSWIRIRIQELYWIRIHSTDFLFFYLPV